MEQLKNIYFVTHLRNWYKRFEQPISSVSLIGGFIFDALTLTRVDKFWENLWVVAHLLIVAVCIIWIHSLENSGNDEKNPVKKHFWLVNILQFFFGGLLSTFLVFYFRSSDIAVNWPFILILAIAFIANERLKSHFTRLTFQVSLLFISIESFAIFLVPLVLHSIGPNIFLISGIVSLIFIALFLLVLFAVHKKKFIEDAIVTIFSVVVIFLTVNILYFTHFLPPIPLSLKDAGIYHTLSRDSQGNYITGYENIGWRKYITLYPPFHQILGEQVYAYSAVFSPSSLNITIVHVWQHYDIQKKEWITKSTINLPVLGGREGGFRTYSTESNLDSGKWRVNVVTLTGEVIGRIRFTIIPSSSEPVVSTQIHT